MTPIPFGPEAKDPLWRWGSFAMGVVGFILLFWLMTLFGTLFLGWTRLIILIVIAIVLSLRSGRRWTLGREPERSFTKKVPPTVAIEGKPGATYVLMGPANPSKGRRVKPRELGPGWWAFYSVVVRAPVALGDVILTAIWRLVGGRWEATGIGRPRTVDGEEFDRASDLPEGAGADAAGGAPQVPDAGG